MCGNNINIDVIKADLENARKSYHDITAGENQTRVYTREEIDELSSRIAILDVLYKLCEMASKNGPSVEALSNEFYRINDELKSIVKEGRTM